MALTFRLGVILSRTPQAVILYTKALFGVIENFTHVLQITKAAV